MGPLAIFGCGFLVFLAAAAYDLVCARYLASANRGSRVPAANWSVAAYIVGLIGLSTVLNQSMWFAIPECLGLWVGTYLGVVVKT